LTFVGNKEMNDEVLQHCHVQSQDKSPPTVRWL